MENIKSAYLAIGYACNQKCRCCPLINKELRMPIIPIKDIERQVQNMIDLGVTDVTISGGEPTIHPNFFDIIKLILDKNLSAHILTNGEKFNSSEFRMKFFEIIGNKQEKISVTTTFHSHKWEEHEYQNQSIGSFKRSLEGVKFLDKEGINISIKHCITKNNYNDLSEFICWAFDNFSTKAEIQLWGIDVCGVKEDIANEMFIDYKEIGDKLEKAIDVYEVKAKTFNRVLTINNLPLCMCDSYYWKYFSMPELDNYIEHMNSGKKMDAISGTKSKNCKRCFFRNICQGVYYSNFEIFGDNIVSPPIIESEICQFKPSVVEYNEKNIEKNYWSPYAVIELDTAGLKLFNKFINKVMLMRLKTNQIYNLLKVLKKGISDYDLIELFNEFNLNGDETMKELLLKGVIE